MLHDLAGHETLPSAVRLNSTGRSTGFLAGPAIGSVLLLALGPAFGIFTSAKCVTTRRYNRPRLGAHRASTSDSTSARWRG